MEVQPIKKPKKHFQSVPEHPEIEQKPSKFRRRGFIILIVTIILIPTYQISKERLEKYQENVKKIILEHYFPNCEQYVLRTNYSGFFPCFGCKSGKIWLNAGEVWRYGIAGIGGEEARYPGKNYYKDGVWFLNFKDLTYTKEVVGTHAECLLAEQQKIFSYPALPEAVRREIKLIRPPGNKQDR